MWNFTINSINYVLESTRDDTSLKLFSFYTLHSMRFSSSSLSICKDSSIITLQNTFYNRQSSLLEYFFLETPWLESHIKTKHSLFFSNIFFVMNCDFSSLWWDIYNRLEIFLKLFWRKGSASDSNLHTFLVSHVIPD